MGETNEKRMELDPYAIAKGMVFGDSAPAEAVAETEETTEAEAVTEAEATTEETASEETAAETAAETETTACEATEEQATEEATGEEESAAPEASPAIPLEEYKTILDAHFQNLRALIKYTKGKDENIQKLSNELQKYREDYCAKTFKAIATLLISFREDCRRSYAELDTFGLSLEKARKFISFLCDDFEELLSNAGCEEDDGVWTFNGKSLEVEPKADLKFPALFEAEPVAQDEPDAIEGTSVNEYLVDAENKIKLILADNAKLDKCLKDYVTLASVIEEDIVRICVYPPIRRLISMYGKLRAVVEEHLTGLGEDNMFERYRSVLMFLINQVEDVLLAGNVTVDTTTDDFFDTKKNRLVRAVVTKDAALDRKIAKQHTECYMMNDKVIYPAKVDVYKYQA